MAPGGRAPTGVITIPAGDPIGMGLKATPLWRISAPVKKFDRLLSHFSGAFLIKFYQPGLHWCVIPCPGLGVIWGRTGVDSNSYIMRANRKEKHQKLKKQNNKIKINKIKYTVEKNVYVDERIDDGAHSFFLCIRVKPFQDDFGIFVCLRLHHLLKLEAQSI